MSTRFATAPRAEFRFLRPALIVGLAVEDWRRHVEFEPVIAGKFRSEVLAERPIGIESRDLIFVLVGHELKEVSRRRARKSAAMVGGGCLCANGCDKLLIGGGVPSVLISGEEVFAARDERIERFFRLFLRRQAGRFHDGAGIDRRRAAEVERALVLLNGDGVQFNRAGERCAADRHKPFLPGETEQEHVRKYRIAQQAARNFGRVDRIDIFLAAGVAQRGDALTGGEVDAAIAAMQGNICDNAKFLKYL